MIEELTDKYPILIIPFGAAVLTLASLILSVIGGWKALADKYRVTNWQATEKWRFQSVKANAVEYSNCVTFGADSERIYLSVIFFSGYSIRHLEFPMLMSSLCLIQIALW